MLFSLPDPVDLFVYTVALQFGIEGRRFRLSVLESYVNAAMKANVNIASDRKALIM